ncbi:MAG: glycoside hydrolase family 2 TIM barrel-domain containing protein [Opitutaceae bacterium]|jgi:beta-glucuronidase
MIDLTPRLITAPTVLWDFAFLGKIGLDSFTPAAVETWEFAPVPSAFDALPDYAGKRGAAVYRTRFTVPAGHAARLEFGAVSMWCRVFVDGVVLRDHACGYAPFTVEVPKSAKTERELVVLVDNRYDFDRVPMHEEYFDFYQYGGIIRPVSLRVLPDDGVFIDHVQTLVAAGYREGKFAVKVWLGDSTSGSVALTTRIDGESECRHAAVTVIGGVATLELVAADKRLWSPETPVLHTLSVALPNGDALTVRFGLRHVEAREGAIWLNGTKIILKGYNRHEWHPSGGPATSPLQMFTDIKLLKDIGCNFVRGSHYPQDQRFLDLCDELGLLVWEENLGWGQREKTFASAKWHADHRESLRAMVRASVNHPSIILWGFLNEAGSDQDYVCQAFGETAATLRSLDPSRLVTYASMFALTDKYYHLADVISLNVYPGWYGCEGVENPLDLIAPHYNQCFAHIDRAGFADKPVIISEIGAEGLYGWRDEHNDFFTETYQAEYLRHACDAALSDRRCSGIALWHFSDVRTYGGGWALKRPRAFNNKGTLDEYRRPKEAYRVVKECFLKIERG